MQVRAPGPARDQPSRMGGVCSPAPPCAGSCAAGSLPVAALLRFIPPKRLQHGAPCILPPRDACGTCPYPKRHGRESNAPRSDME